MSDLSDQASPLSSNLPEFSVSELSQAVKKVVEGTFEHVRVRGEISRPSFPASGHCYFRLKDENAVLDAVCWRGVLGRLSVRPEDGLEVVATGRMTTYPGKSSYQLVIDQIEVAGEGALLKLLEERKRKLAAEGLFAEERKRRLPYLPNVIGVVTSPSGAVIRDILHRLHDRFPSHVLVWPVPVQGETAAPLIAAAIEGFNKLRPGGALPRPDLLIVARGGGSLEDLWAFNEEIVVRAAAESAIPLISAVGHETDTTLIDHAADRRAPTPTAAAEMAVPVRSDLIEQVAALESRMLAAGSRGLRQRREFLDGLGRGLVHPGRMLEERSQRLDDMGERLGRALLGSLERRAGVLREWSARLPHPRQQLSQAAREVADWHKRLVRLQSRLTEPHERALAQLDPGRRINRAWSLRVQDTRQKLDSFGRLLESYSYRNVLQRGFAVLRAGGKVVTDAASVGSGMALDIEMRDGRLQAMTVGSGSGGTPDKTPTKSSRKKPRNEDDQGTLL